MAEPGVRGTMSANGFTAKYVDVTHEDLSIVIKADFRTAEIRATYFIKSDKNGVQIPMIFYADNYLDSFQVFVDGQQIPLLGDDYDSRLEGPITGFEYFNEEDESGRGPISLTEDENYQLNMSWWDMLYFEMDLDSGEHAIEVSYVASQWVDGYSDFNEYSFKYALSPIKNWRSFGGLDFELDIEQSGLNWEDLTINLPKSARQGKWHFTDVPVDTIFITYSPVMDSNAIFFQKLGAYNFALLLMIPLIFIQHFVLLKVWKRSKGKYFNSIGLLIILALPLIFVFAWFNSYDWIDDIIGEHANRNHGYSFFVLLTYPIYLAANFGISAFSYAWYLWLMKKKNSHSN